MRGLSQTFADCTRLNQYSAAALHAGTQPNVIGKITRSKASTNVTSDTIPVVRSLA